MSAVHLSRGTALVEALVAAALLGVGLLGAARLALHAQASAREAHAQLQAQTLAHEALDCVLARQTVCPVASPLTLGGMRYGIALARTPLGASLEELEVTVTWSSPEGQAAADPLRRLVWRTRIASLP